jgi:hypothetical protein
MITDQKIIGGMLMMGTNVFSFPDQYNFIKEIRVCGRTKRIISEVILGKTFQLFSDGEKLIESDSALLYNKYVKKSQKERFLVFPLNQVNKRQDITIVNNSRDEVYAEFLLLTIDSALKDTIKQKIVCHPVVDQKVMVLTTFRTFIDLKEFNYINSWALFSAYTPLGSAQQDITMTMSIGNQKQCSRLLIDGIISQGRYQNLNEVQCDVDLRDYKNASVDIEAKYTGAPILLMIKGK